MSFRRKLCFGVSTAAILMSFGGLLNLLAPPPCPLRFSADAGLLPPRSSLATAGQANAIPAFARKFNVNCMTCHIAPPYLNKTGRLFKERGYLFPNEDGQIEESMQQHQKITGSLILEKYLPLAFRVQSLPADVVPANADGSGAQYEFSPVNYVALMGMGNTFDYGSFNIIAEATAPSVVNLTDLTQNGFSFDINAKIGFHPLSYINVVAGYAPVMSTDPYPSLTSADTPLTIHPRILLASGFDSGVTMSDAAPFLSIYGRAGIVYYRAGLSAPPGGMVAVNPSLAQARVAVDVTEIVEIGAFGLGGKATVPAVNPAAGASTTTNFSLWRTGLDMNVTSSNYALTLLGLVAGDAPQGSGADVNCGASGEFMYVTYLKGRPFLLPVGRLEWVQANNGSSNRVTGFAGLSGFVRDNIRIGLDGSVDLRPAAGSSRIWRGTLYGDLVF